MKDKSFKLSVLSFRAVGDGANFGKSSRNRTIPKLCEGMLICMKNTQDKTIIEFIDVLSSKSPVPGGGGASALLGAVGAALLSMVANLTSGKQKYAEYQQDIEDLLTRLNVSAVNLLGLIDKDAQVFEPLAAAYSIPKDSPGRDEILEDALLHAASVPMEILREIVSITDIVEELSYKGSRLAVSDVGVAAAACRAAMEGAVMNVYINTKLMKNTARAEQINKEAAELLSGGVSRCGAVYNKISDELRSN